MTAFYEVRRAPVHSVLLMPTREIAVSFPKGDIRLGLCGECGFVGNLLFDPSVHSYSREYEETQGYSATFRKFHRELTLSLIDKFDLHGKDVIEIGCGKGEFLALLCELGNNRGTGFDPAFVPERNPAKEGVAVQFITDFYSEKYVHVHGDFVCCKMTLEHIPNTAEFVSTVRRSIGDRHDCVVFFQIPDMQRVLRDFAFWDVYYEHCSYFTAVSLRYLFEKCGFDVLETGTEYDDQYLTITAKPSRGVPLPLRPAKEIQALTEETASFARHCEALVSSWRERVRQFRRDRKKVVIWGSGSKGVAFLTALGMNDAIEYAVDINPYRHGKFMVGSGQEIVSPEFLQSYRPDVAIAMNAIYLPEIQQELDRMRLPTQLLAV
jgi:SAM-dependent methyltransferase